MVPPSGGATVKIRHVEPDNFKYTFHVVVIERSEDTEFVGRVQRIFAAGPGEGELEMCGNDICRRFKGQQKAFKNSDIIQ